MFEVVGTSGRARSWAGRRLLARCPCWGNSQHPSSASGRPSAWGVCAAPGKMQRASLGISGAAQSCWARSDAGFPFTTSTQTICLVVPSVCCLVGEGGEESKHGLCLGALPARIAAGPGGWGCVNANAFQIDQLLVLFCLFCFLLQQSVIEQVSWDN